MRKVRVVGYNGNYEAMVTRNKVYIYRTEADPPSQTLIATITKGHIEVHDDKYYYDEQSVTYHVDGEEYMNYMVYDENDNPIIEAMIR